MNNCASCHGMNLTGGTGLNLTEARSDFSKEEMIDISENGKGVM